MDNLTYKDARVNIGRVTPYEKSSLHSIVMDLDKKEVVSPERQREISQLTDRIQIKEALDLIQGGDAGVIPPILGSVHAMMAHHGVGLEEKERGN